MNRIRSLVMSTPVKTWASILTCLNEPSARREPLRTETKRGQTAGPSLARLDLMFEKPQKVQASRQRSWIYHSAINYWLSIELGLFA